MSAIVFGYKTREEAEAEKKMLANPDHYEVVSVSLRSTSTFSPVSMPVAYILLPKGKIP